MDFEQVKKDRTIMIEQCVEIQGVGLANHAPMVLFGGLNVLEGRELAFRTCERFKTITDRLKMPFVFKASFDKANRSSVNSYRGPGLEEGLRLFADLKTHFGVPILTDLHEPAQAQPLAEVVDVLQIPAFLSRQTDLVCAAAKTGRVLNIKKAQFLAPQEMANIIQKCVQTGNAQIILCERGTMFGYNNLVVDMLGFPILKSFGFPVIFDVTHALQKPGGKLTAADGRRSDTLHLARSAMAQGLAGLFLETHPEPDAARCDGPSALPLEQLEPFLKQIQAIDQLVKSMPVLKIE